MTATSVLVDTRNGILPFRFRRETSRIPGGTYQRFTQSQHQIPGNYENDPNVMSFVSEQTKVFLTLYNGMYHFWHDSVAGFVYQFKKTPEALFIFDTANLYDLDDKYLTTLKNILIQNGVQHRFIKTTNEIDIVANNFYFQEAVYDELDSGNACYDLVQPLLKNKDSEPFRKVYVSRSHMPPREYSDKWVDGPSFKNDNRIDNEKRLEDFFESMGFEICVPERMFNNFTDQINYFYETKTMVHLTGGGGTNAMWMRPGSNVIELTTSMCVTNGQSVKEPGKQDVEEALHHFYAALAYNKNHNFLSIQNPTRSSEILIGKIQNNPFLKSVFGSL
jgi:hypothetical protein